MNAPFEDSMQVVEFDGQKLTVIRKPPDFNLASEEHKEKELQRLRERARANNLPAQHVFVVMGLAHKDKRTSKLVPFPDFPLYRRYCDGNRAATVVMNSNTLL